VWLRRQCHRRIIADYLLVADARVFHTLGRGSFAPASLTKAATPQPDGTLTYLGASNTATPSVPVTTASPSMLNDLARNLPAAAAIAG
jgi:hypothetical protein